MTFIVLMNELNFNGMLEKLTQIRDRIKIYFIDFQSIVSIEMIYGFQLIIILLKCGGLSESFVEKLIYSLSQFLAHSSII